MSEFYIIYALFARDTKSYYSIDNDMELIDCAIHYDICKMKLKMSKCKLIPYIIYCCVHKFRDSFTLILHMFNKKICTI